MSLELTDILKKLVGGGVDYTCPQCRNSEALIVFRCACEEETILCACCVTPAEFSEYLVNHAKACGRYAKALRISRVIREESEKDVETKAK